MIDSDTIVEQRHGHNTAHWVYCARAVGLALVLCAGCAEHRITLEEFLGKQELRAGKFAVPSEREQIAAKDLVDRQLGPYRVGPADVLLVTLTGVDDAALLVPIQVRVDRNGEVDLPLVGAISLSELELEDVEDRIKEAFVPAVFRDAVVYVDLVSPEQTQVLVTGAVSMPGLVPLRRTDRNLLYAVVGAGGTSELASGRVTLHRVRRPNEEVTLDLTDARQLQAALALEPLENGDIVTVHAAMPNTVFVGGLVAAPHPQVYAAGVKMTVLQVLAAAGGLRTDIHPKEGTLIRRMPGGHDEHVLLNLDRIARGEDRNIMLEPGDILWVPHTLETRIQDFIQKNVFMRAGITATYSVTGIEFMNRTNIQNIRGGTGAALEDTFDPFGFLTRGSVLQTISTAPPLGP